MNSQSLLSTFECRSKDYYYIYISIHPLLTIQNETLWKRRGNPIKFIWKITHCTNINLLKIQALVKWEKWGNQYWVLPLLLTTVAATHLVIKSKMLWMCFWRTAVHAGFTYCQIWYVIKTVSGLCRSVVLQSSARYFLFMIGNVSGEKEGKTAIHFYRQKKCFEHCVLCVVKHYLVEM